MVLTTNYKIQSTHFYNENTLHELLCKAKDQSAAEDNL